jgi:hypothetical protein
VANHQMKDWEIIADNVGKAGWSWGCVAALDREGEPSGLVMLIGATENVSLCAPMKNLTAFVEFELAIQSR